MNNDLKVNASAIKDTALDIKNISDNLQDIVDTIRQATKNMATGEIWKSDSQEIYASQINSLIDEFENLNTEIKNSVNYLENYANAMR